MDSPKKIPVTLMFDPENHAKLKAASKSTRISMSELVRISVARLILEIGDPERPDPTALAGLLLLSEGE